MKRENKIDSATELTRLICIILILFSHYVSKGKIVFSNEGGPQRLSMLFWGGGKLAVNIFVLLSGYYASNKSNSGKKIIELYLQTVFFSVFSLLLYFLFDKESIDRGVIIKSIFPVFNNVYWYVTNFMLLLFLKPWVDRTVLSVNENEHFKLCFLLLLVFSIIPTVFSNINPFFSEFSWFACVYVFGSYLKRIEGRILAKIKGAHCGLIFLLTWLFIWGSMLYFQRIGYSIINYFAYMYRLPMFVSCVSLFLALRQVKCGIFSKYRISQHVFAVYLLHDSLFFRNHFWGFIHTDQFFGRYAFVIQMLIVSVALMVGGFGIEIMRCSIHKCVVKTSFYRWACNLMMKYSRVAGG